VICDFHWHLQDMHRTDLQNISAERSRRKLQQTVVFST
jgi:hypothetical protein